MKHRFIVVLLVVYTTIFRFNRLLDSGKILHTLSNICSSILIFGGWINSTIISLLGRLHGLFLFYLAVRFGEDWLLLWSLDAFWGQDEAGLLLLIRFNNTGQSEERVGVARVFIFVTQGLLWLKILSLQTRLLTHRSFKSPFLRILYRWYSFKDFRALGTVSSAFWVRLVLVRSIWEFALIGSTQFTYSRKATWPTSTTDSVFSLFIGVWLLKILPAIFWLVTYKTAVCQLFLQTRLSNFLLDQGFTECLDLIILLDKAIFNEKYLKFPHKDHKSAFYVLQFHQIGAIRYLSMVFEVYPVFVIL